MSTGQKLKIFEYLPSNKALNLSIKKNFMVIFQLANFLQNGKEFGFNPQCGLTSR
jgi:hypothetical protein